MSAHSIDKVEGTEGPSVVTGAYSDLGARKRGACIFFSVYAPMADAIYLVGTFNGWKDTHPLKKEASGIWRISVEAKKIPDGTAYKYMIYRNGKATYSADPYMTATDGGPYFNSIYRDVPDDIKYTYEEEKHVGYRDVPLNVYCARADRWLCDKKGYAPDIASLGRELLPYILQMGYTHISLSGMTEKCYDLRTGRSEDACFAVSAWQGGADALRYFVRLMHSAEIGVLVDMSFYKTLGSTDADIAFYTDNALYWVNCFGADGITLDRSSGRGEEFFSRLIHNIKSSKNDAYIISISDKDRHIDNADTVLTHPYGESGCFDKAECLESELCARMSAMASVLLSEGKMITRMGEEIAQSINVGDVFDRSVQDRAANSRFQLCCSELNDLYLSHPAFWNCLNGDFAPTAENEDGLTVIKRSEGGEELLFVADQIGDGGDAPVAGDGWQIIFDSCRTLGMVDTSEIRKCDKECTLHIPPYGAAVLKHEK